MTNKKTTRRALFSSIMALLLCCSMLVGTTFAWFTDSVTSTGNIIKSGTLDVTMEWKDATATGKQISYKDASAGPIFNYDLWEPGYVEAKNVKISNVGTLDFKYQLGILATGQVSKLTDAIDVYYAETELTLANRAMTELTKIGTLTEILKGMPTNTSGKLLDGESVTVTIALKMREEAGNEYQNLSVGSDFCVQLLATQLDSEFDSFGPEYDKESQWLVSGAGFAAANGMDDVIVVVKNANTDNEVAVFTIPGVRTKAETNVSAHVEEQASVDEAVWTVATQGGEAKSFDIHVDGLNDSNESVEVKLFIGKGLESPKLYHGTGNPTVYTEVTPVNYNASTGFITFETADFSPFAVVYEKALSVGTAAAWDGTADTSWYDPADPKTAYEISTAEQLAGLAELVSGDTTFAGVTFTLTSNLDLYCEDTTPSADGDPLTFRPIGDHSKDGTFEGVFDGNGKTISNLYQNGWDLGYEWGAYGSYGLFGNVNNATVKNLTLSGGESYIEGGDTSFVAGSATGTCVFENITIEDSISATYNNGNGGIIGWSGAGNYTFKNITIAEDCVLAGLWGSFDSSIGGIVGQAEPGATYNVENVDIACRLDAYNDCTASYDYYNYRMCGMIIGRLEETTTIDGSNYPDTSKYDITCNNVTVTYGDWANYHYCRAQGARASRVEAGYSYDGIAADYDHSACTAHHMELIAFDQIFGGDQYAVKGLKEYTGVTVVYNNK